MGMREEAEKILKKAYAVAKLATPISNGGLFGTPPGFCTDTCLWQVQQIVFVLTAAYGDSFAYSSYLLLELIAFFLL